MKSSIGKWKNLAKDLYKAIEASIAAGKEIMKIYEGEDFQVEKKADNSPLTIADKRANEIINSLLANTYPIISEENKMLSYEERKKWEKCWIVDPLDGTKEFLKRNGEFTVNIALAEKGLPRLGVIYLPVTKVLYVGDVQEKIAYKVEINGDEEIGLLNSLGIKLFPLTDKERIRVVGSRSHTSEEIFKYIEELEKEYNKIAEIVPVGSSIKFCLIAEGLADVYPRFGPTMEWDTAAGQAICEAVGLEVLDMVTGKKIVYNRENPINSSFVVSNLG